MSFLPSLCGPTKTRRGLFVRAQFTAVAPLPPRPFCVAREWVMKHRDLAAEIVAGNKQKSVQVGQKVSPEGQI